ncbi:unnamed protein product [Cunninghamella blakesleeana]
MFQTSKKDTVYSQYDRLQQDDGDDNLEYDDWGILLNILIATRDYINNKWLLKKANKATLANVPPVIVSDIQQGNIPLKSDPTLREIDLRGWTIIHRRLYRVKKQKKKRKQKKKLQQQSTRGGVYHEIRNGTDDELDYPYSDTSLSSLQPSNQLYASVFIKTDYVPRSISYLPKQTKYNLNPIPVNKEEYARIVESVRLAINDHIQPIRISQGSSGSYFCRDRDNNIVGVFKPKNEEPYGQLNPKWAKWIHRHLFPCCFGRSCLIPNLGYISEAAASLVDRQLGTCIVPTTNLDHFSSPSFHYAYLDRRRYRRSTPSDPYTLPLKIGSFQCFLRGFLDANVFLRDHPWPLDASSTSIMRFGGATGSVVWSSCLGQTDDNENNIDDDNNNNKYMNEEVEQNPFLLHHDDDDDDHQHQHNNNNNNNTKKIKDNPPIKNHIHAQQQQQISSQEQEQVQLHQDNLPRESTIDDYVALNMNLNNNSDDGGDTDDTIQHSSYNNNSINDNNNSNKKNQKTTFQWTPQLQSQFKREFEHLVILDYLIRNTDRGLDNWMVKYCEGDAKLGSRTSNSSIDSNSKHTQNETSNSSNNNNNNNNNKTSTCQHGKNTPHIHIAAIDNGLAFPFKHPDEWRSYPYGWLALPNGLVGKPFSEETRKRFLPILSDPIWWRKTVDQLRLLFQIDPDFNERMFQRQMSVLRGQGFNLVRVLKDEHAGPLDLVAMERILVNQEDIFIEYDEKILEERLSSSRQKKKQLQQSTSTSSSQQHQQHQQQHQQIISPQHLKPISIDHVMSSPSSMNHSHQQHNQLLDISLSSPNSSITSLPIQSKLQEIIPSSSTSTADYSTNNNNTNNNKNNASSLLSNNEQQRKSSLNGPRRLRPKRSSSFHTFDSSIISSSRPKSPTTSLSNQESHDFLPWKDKVRKRLSSIKVGRRRRLALRQVVGSDGEMDDDDDHDDNQSIDSFDDINGPIRKRVLFVMETIKVVKSKLPYFTCC